MLGQALILTSLVGCALSEPAFKETFDESWESRWKVSTWKKDEGTAGQFTLTAGKWFGDEKQDMGIQTGPDARFYNTYATLDKPFNNEGKDLVLQFSVKHEQQIDCGGGYIKLVPSSVSEKAMESFSGETPYAIMFGPDICGHSTKRVHVILPYKDDNHLIDHTIPCETDVFTHVYTLAIRPDNSYEVFIDTESVRIGTLVDDWKMLPPKEIPDPGAKKPEDWVDKPMMEDPDDKKPDDWEDIPRTIPDPDATKPDDWDEAEDGEWTAPEKPNPEYKGEWRPKMIENPEYKGPWKAPMIPNKEFKDDPKLYVVPEIKYVGFELWQVKAGSIFDNIMLTHNLDEALQFAKDTWGKTIEAEKAMKAEQDAKEEATFQEATKSAAAEEEADEYEDPVEDSASAGTPESSSHEGEL